MGFFSPSQYRHMLNDLVITTHDGTVGRFIGFHRDMIDWCYLLRVPLSYPERYTMKLAEKVKGFTCVGGISSLRGIKHYDYLDGMFTREGAGPVATMRMIEQTKEYQNEGYFDVAYFREP